MCLINAWNVFGKCSRKVLKADSKWWHSTFSKMLEMCSRNAWNVLDKCSRQVLKKDTANGDTVHFRKWLKCAGEMLQKDYIVRLLDFLKMLEMCLRNDLGRLRDFIFYNSAIFSKICLFPTTSGGCSKGRKCPKGSIDYHFLNH